MEHTHHCESISASRTTINERNSTMRIGTNEVWLLSYLVLVVDRLLRLRGCKNLELFWQQKYYEIPSCVDSLMLNNL